MEREFLFRLLFECRDDEERSRFVKKWARYNKMGRMKMIRMFADKDPEYATKLSKRDREINEQDRITNDPVAQRKMKVAERLLGQLQIKVNEVWEPL